MSKKQGTSRRAAVLRAIQEMEKEQAELDREYEEIVASYFEEDPWDEGVPWDPYEYETH